MKELSKRLSLALAALVLSLAATTVHAQSPTAKQVFDSMIQALGGKAYLDVKEIQVNGRFFGFRRDEVSAAELYWDYIKFPDMERTEFGKDKQKRVEINRGSEGWNITPPVKGKGLPDVEPKPARETQKFLNDFKTSFEYVPRFVVNAPKTSLVLGGTDVVDYKRCDILEIRDADKNLMRVYIDRATHLPVKVQMRFAGEATLKEEAYANWHKFDGVMTPLMVVRSTDGVKTMEIRAEKVSYNPGLPDSLFAPPVTPSK